jgi:hypothetical protein
LIGVENRNQERKKKLMQKLKGKNCHELKKFETRTHLCVPAGKKKKQIEIDTKKKKTNRN